MGTKRARTGASGCRSSSFLGKDLNEQSESSERSTGWSSAHELHHIMISEDDELNDDQHLRPHLERKKEEKRFKT